MKALIKGTTKTSIENINRPIPMDDNDIIIKVEMAGLCRTDILMANGEIKGKDKDIVTLGHEFSGTIENIHQNHNHDFNIGDNVVVMPVMPCKKCVTCTRGETQNCPNTSMLGIDYNGAFAEYISVPAETIYRLPENLSFKVGAYCEPVAAALSVLKSGIQSHQSGMIYGDNRFGQLIYRILQAHGFENITIHTPSTNDNLPKDHFDFAIETLATTEAMTAIFQSIKPQGTVIIKSRKHDPVGINFNMAVMKEISLKAVNYAPFQDAIDLLAREDFNIDDLLGDTFSLNDFETVFDYAQTNETLKIFFNPAL